MNFGLSYGPKDYKVPNCVVCGREVQAKEKVLIERRTLHFGCFKCAICGVQLEQGECAMDEHLSRFGPTWFCLNHHLLPPKQKEEILAKRGYKWRDGVKPPSAMKK